MSISYSGIVGYGKPTLPSVESWGTNNNIIKDPPRSVFTRRRDKVGTNSMIVEEVETGSDRIAEVIMAYPRGVNPMVGVSYNGQGNAGIHSGQALLTRGQQAKLPYRVAMGGAFRPPVLAPVDLLPLSRMPRLITKVNCTINNPDFRKKLFCTAEKRTYRPVILNKSCEAKKTMNIKKPVEVIDRRNTNVRKNVLTLGVEAHKSNPSQGQRTAIGEMPNKSMKVSLGASALHLNHAQRQDTRNGINLDVKKSIGHTSGASALDLTRVQRRDTNGATNVDVGKSIGRTLISDVEAPKNGFRKSVSMANSTGSLRAIGSQLFTSAEATRTGIQRQSDAPSVVTSCRESCFAAKFEPVAAIRRVEQEKPQYKRVFGMGGVLAPNSGVYNTGLSGFSR